MRRDRARERLIAGAARAAVGVACGERLHLGERARGLRRRPARASWTQRARARPEREGGDREGEQEGHEGRAIEAPVEHRLDHSSAGGSARGRPRPPRCGVPETGAGANPDGRLGIVPPRAPARRRRPQDARRLHAHLRARADRGNPRAGRAAEGPARRAHLGDRLRRRRLGDPLHARPADARRRPGLRVAGDLRPRGVLQRDEADAQRAAGRARRTSTRSSGRRGGATTR